MVAFFLSWKKSFSSFSYNTWTITLPKTTFHRDGNLTNTRFISIKSTNVFPWNTLNREGKLALASFPINNIVLRRKSNTS